MGLYAYVPSRRSSFPTGPLTRFCVNQLSHGKGRVALSLFPHLLIIAHTRTLKALEKANYRIYRAWRLKDEFEQFWEYKAPWAAERFLKCWTTSALRSRLEPLRKFVRTLRQHFFGVLAFVNTRLTNAIAEGLNRIVQIVKNRASGFRTLDAFNDMIFLTVGDINIPEQIPKRFRTL